jgi:TolA-binding protein
MFRVLNFLLVLILFFAVSCGKDPNDLSNLGEKELLQKAEEFYNQKNIQKTIECFDIFLKKYPKSDKAPITLKNLAGIYSNDLKDFNSAIVQYKRLITEYPDNKECPNATFTIAFLYANEIKDITQAKTYYELFLQKYPTHEAAASARFEMETLGKSTDEVLNKIIKEDKK